MLLLLIKIRVTWEREASNSFFLSSRSFLVQKSVNLYNLTSLHTNMGTIQCLRLLQLITGGMLLFSCPVVSNSLWPHGLQHARLPCLSLSSRVCSNSCPSSWWCHPAISSSVASFSSCPQFFPASGSFPMSHLFTSGGQNIGASASVLPVNIQGLFPLGLTVWSPCCPRNSQESSLAPQFKSINSSVLSLLYGPTLILVHDYWKNHSFDYAELCRKSDVSSF